MILSTYKYHCYNKMIELILVVIILHLINKLFAFAGL